MRLTRHTRRTSARAARLLALSALSFLCLSCLALSIFSFELRTADAAATPASDDAGAPQSASGGARYEVPQQKQKEAAAREEADAGQSARGRLAQALSSGSPQTRARAACEAGRKRAVELIPALASMLGDDAPVEPVKCWGSGNWSPALDTFKQPSPGEQAAIALASMGAPAVEPLSESLDSGDASVRRNAAWAVGELTNMRGDERAGAVPQLVALVGDRDEWVRMASVRALGEIRDERAAAQLVAALADGEWRVRELAAWSLGEMKEERAVENLCGLLASDAQAGVRAMAAWALGEIQNRRAVASLKQALDDPESRVREKAKWALSEIEGSDG